MNHNRCIFVSAIEKQTIAKRKSKKSNTTKFFSISKKKPKPKSKAYAVKSDDGEKPEFPIYGETDKKASHEKPKRTNIQKPLPKLTAEKPRNPKIQNLTPIQLSLKKPTGSKPLEKI